VAIFLTGSTGYIGAHIAHGLLEGHRDPLNLLVRARDQHEAEVRLWNALQLHLDFPRFHNHLYTRIRVFRGDLTSPMFGLDQEEYTRLIEPEVGEELPECEPAGHAGSGQTGSPCPEPPRTAAHQPCEHGGGGGQTQQ
jgi:hypothetical protein